MPQRIIYTGTDRDGNPCCCVIIPTGELPLEVVARKDVPQGVPYKIIDTVDVPSDRTFRAAWEAVIDAPSGTGDPDGYWAEKAAEEAAEQAKRQEMRQARETATDAEVVAEPEATTDTEVTE